MKPERAIGAIAGIIALGIFAIIPKFISEYRLGSRAEYWNTATGRVLKEPFIYGRERSLPSRPEYEEIEYSFEDRSSRTFVNSAKVPKSAGASKGSVIEIRYNPEDSTQSLPIVSITEYKSKNMRMIVFAILASIGMGFVARRLW